MKASVAKRLKDLEVENTRLKRLLAEAELGKAMLKELAKGASDAEPSPPCSRELAAVVRGLRISERKACEVVGRYRSTQRFAAPTPSGDEEDLRAFLRAFSKKRPRWGWRRAAKALRREAGG